MLFTQHARACAALALLALPAMARAGEGTYCSAFEAGCFAQAGKGAELHYGPRKPAFAELWDGQRVTLLEARGPAGARWWRIDSSRGVVGWVRERHLVPAAAPAPVVAPEPPQAESATPAEAGPVAAPDRSSEIARVRADLASADRATRIEACKSLAYSGITDESLFDAIEKKVLADYSAALRRRSGDRELEQEASWCAKSLAYSGNTKYRPTLEKLAASPRARRLGEHAAVAASWIEDFARWNAVINSTANHRPGQSWAVTRVINKLQSSEPALQREALKDVKTLGDDPTRVYDLVDARLRAAYLRGSFDDNEEDLLAWHCRALGDSGNPKYRDTLHRAANDAPSAKLQKHARNALMQLGAQSR